MRALRLQQMKDFIFERDAVSFEDICERFGISINTARRDVSMLEKDGSISKVYGGVKANKDTGLTPFKLRYISNLDQKIAICRYAANFVNDGDVVYLDPGTTVHNILDFLPNKKITVLSASLNVIMKAANMDNIRLYTLSGTLNRDSNSFEDIGAYLMLKRFNITKAFFAASGFSLQSGAMIGSTWEFEMKNYAVKNSTASYLLIDNSKLSKTAMMKYAEPDEIKNVITCAPIDDEYVKYFAENGVKLHYAPV